jgi:hypothetical protein
MCLGRIVVPIVGRIIRKVALPVFPILLFPLDAQFFWFTALLDFSNPDNAILSESLQQFICQQDPING